MPVINQTVPVMPRFLALSTHSAFPVRGRVCQSGIAEQIFFALLANFFACGCLIWYRQQRDGSR